MLKTFINSARSFARFIASLLVTLVAGFAAWNSWQLYDNEKLSRQFIKEGQPVEVQITATDRGNHTWYDQFTNHVYISFSHLGRPYSIRYTQEDGWVRDGDRLSLLYHQKLDAFRQPGKQIGFVSRLKDHSRLIDFTIASMWSDERKWQVLALAFSTLFIMLLLGMLTSIIRLPWLHWVGPLIMVLLVFAGTLYFSYNTLQYYSYYQKVRAGNPATVKVLATDYNARSKRSDGWYTYRATVLFNNKQRIIPIERSDYEKLQPGDPLPVIYNSRLDDMMPADYSAGYVNLFITLFMWCFTIFLARQYLFKRVRNNNGAHEGCK